MYHTYINGIGVGGYSFFFLSFLPSFFLDLFISSGVGESHLDLELRT